MQLKRRHCRRVCHRRRRPSRRRCWWLTCQRHRATPYPTPPPRHPSMWLSCGFHIKLLSKPFENTIRLGMSHTHTHTWLSGHAAGCRPPPFVLLMFMYALQYIVPYCRHIPPVVDEFSPSSSSTADIGATGQVAQRVKTQRTVRVVRRRWVTRYAVTRRERRYGRVTLLNTKSLSKVLRLLISCK